MGGDRKSTAVGGFQQGDRTAPAPRAPQHQERQVRNGDINGELGEGIDGENGWHQVTYKKKAPFAGKQQGQTESRRGVTNLADKRAFIRRETEEAYQKAFKEGKCFRCLSKDHKRANCREPVRCFKCNRIGHKYGGCKIQQQEIKRQYRPQQYKYPQHHGISYAGVLKPSEKAPNLTQPETTVKSKRGAPPGKVSMDDLWEVRPEETHVYMPIREGLRPQNMDLRCAGLVVMTQGQPTADIPGLLAHRLARQFGGTALQNEVYDGNEEDDAPFILMVQNRARLQEIVWNSPYTLRRGVQVGVMLWDQEWSMVYEPEPFQAWLRLWDLPLHAWNTEDLRKVTTGVGRITAILPHGRQAGHFRHVTIRVACEDPHEISRFLKYHDNGHARRVRVQILHWREWQQGPYPLQQNQWPPEQNPGVNPPPPVNPPDIPPLSPPEETYTS